MAVGFTILYHPKVSHEDIPALSREWRLRVRSAVEEKLMTSPERFGVPLRASLRGYRKLRVGDYRVVFRIAARNVIVLAIIHRSVVYKEIPKRSA